MSRIRELVAALCGDGVPYLPIGDPSVSTRVVAGATPKSEIAAYWDGGTIPWMSSGEVNKGTVYSTDKLITQAGYDATSTKLVPPGTVVVALAGQGKTRGTVARTRIELCTNQSLASIVVAKSMDSDFLYHFLQTQYVQLREVSAGDGARGGLNLQSIRAYRVPVPPLEVQREIVGILDSYSMAETRLGNEVKGELDARRRQHAWFRSVVLDGVIADADRVQLGSLGRVVTGRTPKSSDLSAWGSDIDFVTPGDIKNGMRTVSETTRHLSSIGAASMSTVLIPKGSILVTCIGADMGKTAINANECVPNQQINAIVLNEGVLNSYVFHVLTAMRNSLREKGAQGGGTMPLINKSDFSRIEVPLPSVPVQVAVAAQLDRSDAVMGDLLASLIAELNARRQQYEFYRGKVLAFEEAGA